jgi:hypothetical protein
MKSRVRQMWERFVDAYWAGARRRFEEETLPWMYPPVKPLSPAETPTPLGPTSLVLPIVPGSQATLP